MEYGTEKEILQPILKHGMEGMSGFLQKLFNLAMKSERENAMLCSPPLLRQKRKRKYFFNIHKTCILYFIQIAAR